LAGSLAKPAVRSLADALAAPADPPSPHLAAPDDLATLIYTSGTTGRPKGVMLSHSALLWNVRAAAEVIPPRRDDVFLSILPLAHAFERTVGYYLPIMGGCTVAYARSAQDLRADLVALHPTAILGVPLLFERMHSAIRANVSGRFVARTLLRLAVFIGWRRFAAVQRGKRPDLVVRALWPLLEQIVARPVLAAFGGRLRVAVCGGAPLDQHVARFLIGLGLPLIEGYGLTEAAPVVASNGLNDNLPGSVGVPLRTPSIMKGYWKDTAETARALDAAGWLATGDAAEITNGRIYIRGRIKETIVLSIGEKINPNVVEAELTRDPLFAQAMVVGDRRPFLAAVVVLDAAAWRRLCADKRLDPERPEQQASKAALLERITARLARLPKYAQVRAVHPTLQPWTVETGLLTPSLKIKRGSLQQLFTREIEALYG
jgi:long-chain acyl-CoA synthetase